MTVVKLTVDPHQTPEEEARLVARIAAAITESTGDEQITFEVEKNEHVKVSGGVADRMSRGARWSA